MRDTLFFKILPVFCLIMLAAWGFELLNNVKSGNKERMIIDIVLCIIFGIGFVASLAIKFYRK